MIGCDPVLFECSIMFRRRVAFVGAPSVLRIFGMESQHIIVPIGLGEDTSGCDGHIRCISMHDRVGRDLQQFAFRHIGFPFIAVHKNMLRSNGQLIQGSLHPENRTLEDIPFVYLLCRHLDYGPAYRFPFDDRS